MDDNDNYYVIKQSTRSCQLPAGCGAIRKVTGLLQKQIEAAIIEAKGSISISDAARVQSIIRCEQLIRLGYRWLRQNEADLSPAERVSYCSLIASNTARRDKAIDLLKIDAAGDKDAFAGITFEHSPEQAND